MNSLTQDPTWSPEVGFKGKIIGESGARSLEEELEHEANLIVELLVE